MGAPTTLADQRALYTGDRFVTESLHQLPAFALDHAQARPVLIGDARLTL
jgi:hypothetical protein